MLRLIFLIHTDEHEKQKLSRQIELEQMELIRAELVAQGKYDVFYRIEDMIKIKPNLSSYGN